LFVVKQELKLLMVIMEQLIALTHKSFVRLMESSTALETVWEEVVV